MKDAVLLIFLYISQSCKNSITVSTQILNGPYDAISIFLVFGVLQAKLFVHIQDP